MDISLTLRKLQILDSILHQLSLLNCPTKTFKAKLDQMESLVFCIPRKPSADLSKMWANKLATYTCLYASSSSLPPLQPNRESVPFPQIEALDYDRLLSAGQPKAEHFGDYSPQQHYWPQQISDNQPLKSILKETKDCHTFDSKTEPDYSDEDSGGSSDSGISSDLYQLQATSSSSASLRGQSTSSSRIINCGHNPSQQISKYVIRPSSSSINSNQMDHIINSSAAGRFSHNFAGSEFDSDSLAQSEDLSPSSSHQPKRFIISPRDHLRPELVAILSAPRAVVDADDIEGLKWLLRAVSRVVWRLYQTFMLSDEELPAELFQLAFDKLPKKLQYRYREDYATNEIVLNSLNLIKQFLKNQIVAFLTKLREGKFSILCNGRYGTNLFNHIPTFCVYCKNFTDHTVADCPVIRIVQRHVLCFYCLKDGHTTRFCPKNSANFSN